MNEYSVHPAAAVGRFFLATAIAAGAQFVVNAILSPFNPMGDQVDSAFWRLFIGQAILVGNAMVFFLRKSRYGGAKLFGAALLCYVGAAQILGHVETVAFNFLFGFTAAQIVFMILSQAATALLFVPLAMAVAGKWKKKKEEGAVETAEQESAAFPGLGAAAFLARLAILGVLWYFCYMLAGFFVADPITHGYYAAKKADLAAINAWLPFLQFFRGTAWTLLVVLGVRVMNRPREESGLLVGLVFGIFHAASLLLPNPFMPAEMRLSHFPEIVLSLVMFGSLAVAVLSYRGKKSPDRD